MILVFLRGLYLYFQLFKHLPVFLGFIDQKDYSLHRSVPFGKSLLGNVR